MVTVGAGVVFVSSQRGSETTSIPELSLEGKLSLSLDR